MKTKSLLVILGLTSAAVVAISLASRSVISEPLKAPALHTGEDASPKQRGHSSEQLNYKFLQVVQRSKSACVKGACDTSPLQARTIEEAKWLERNGYPTLDQANLYYSSPDSIIVEDALQGSLAASAVLGKRKAMNGSEGDGLLLLKETFDKGGLYSLYETSYVYSQHPQLRNVVESAAYLKLAYLLGDSVALDLISHRFPKLTPVESKLIDERASDLLDSYAKGQRRRPRPVM